MDGRRKPGAVLDASADASLPEGVTPSNLPVQLSSFVGRREELREVERLIPEQRLLTLTGAGGCGKTRLAVQAASEVLKLFPDGAWWVELAPVGDGRLVGAAIAEVLGVRPLPGVTELQAVSAFLADRRALIVLDNCEHLIDACAEAAEAILGAQQVAVLATSRVPLGVSGEVEWRVPSLSLPGSRDQQTEAAVAAEEPSDAVALFTERAAATGGGVVLGPNDAGLVAQICTELDGLPLAIELAAARLRMLSVAEVAAGLSDRFRLLTDGPRTATPRLKTLRASVDWSHELLSGEEQVLLRRLAVFAGGFTLEAAADVCAGDEVEAGSVLGLLGSLVDQSLVIADVGEAGSRYRLLETVRQYGLEKLAEAGEEEPVRARHRDHFLAFAEGAGPHLETGRQLEFLGILDPEAANLAAAIEFALDGDPRVAVRISVALNRWWCARGRFAEAELAYSRSLTACDEGEHALRARGFERRAWVATNAGDYEAAESHATEALALAEEAGDQVTAARARCELGAALVFADPQAGRMELKRAAELAKAAGDDWAFVEARQLAALSYLYQHDHSQAARASEEVTALAEALGDPFQISRRWFYVSWMGSLDGRFAEARDAAERILAAVSGVGEPAMEAVADNQTAFVDIWSGEPERALERLHLRLERSLRLGAGMMAPAMLTSIASAELAVGRPEDACARLEGLVPLVDGRYRFIAAWALETLAMAQRLLSDDRAESTARRACDLAPLGRLTLARLATAREDWVVAREHALAHLDACVEGGHATFIPGGLDALAEVAAGTGGREDAVRLFAAAEGARDAIGVARMPPEAEHWKAIGERLRAALGDDAYEAAREQGARLTAEEAVEWARRARGPRSRPPGGWDSLTPTESRVADLVAEGLTNPQIAERMFVSAGTIRTHVGHIFKKLEIHNRSQLAAQAAQRRNGGFSGPS